MLSVKGGTYLSRRGYAILKDGNEEIIETIKSELTVKPFVNPDMPGADLVLPFPNYRESTKKIYMPKYYGLQKLGPVDHNDLDEGKNIHINFKGSLRQDQLDPFKAYTEAVAHPQKQGGIISLFCGGGKTVMALYLIAHFKKKALIVVHKEFLLNQWKEEIAKFLPDARIGMIKQSKVHVEDKDIVIASLQSLSMRDYPVEIFKEFGMVVIDECHHMGAEVFSRALPKITCRIMLGLSATLDRSDGMSKVFYWHLGKPVYQQKKRVDNGTNIVMYSYYDPHPEYGREQFFQKAGRKVLKIPNMISAICSFKPRNDKIIEILIDIFDKDIDRQCLILSERISQLKELERMLHMNGITSTGYYIGGMSASELTKSESKKVILASYQMSSEGMNIPSLNTMILASPISSVEQSIGRIQRQKPNERVYTPLVIDIWDRFSRFQGQGRTRIKHYKSQGYTITHEGHTYGNEETITRDLDEKNKDDASSNPKNSSSKFLYRDD